jgi:hypothetical protein
MAIIWGGIVNGVTNILDKATDVIFKERRMRARNEIDKLEAERKELMSKPAFIINVKRVMAIDKRLEELNSYLKNAEVK